MHDPIGVAAARALSAALDRPVTLAGPRTLKEATRSVVVRYDALGAALSWPSVIVKFIRDDPATGFGEWAALAFPFADAWTVRRAVLAAVSRLAAAAALVPDLAPVAALAAGLEAALAAREGHEEREGR